MRKFVFKTLLFVAPFAILQIVYLIGYKTDHGDLTRLGNIIEFYPSYRKNLFENKDFTPFFKEIKDINLKNKNIEYLAIGDSFTFDEQGYKNELGALVKREVYSFDKKLLINGNPFQTLSALIKTDFFYQNKVEYVVLQSVERYLALRMDTFDENFLFEKSIKESDINIEKDNHFKISDREFPSKSIFIVPYLTFKYCRGDEYIKEIYRLDTNKELFSVDKKELLIFKEDIQNVNQNNNPIVAEKLNNTLNDLQNQLNKYNVKLVFLPAPDKMTAYFKNVINKDNYTEPLVLSRLEGLPKDYIYINTLEIINRYNVLYKDFYFYDDTHWSFKGAREVAREIVSESTNKSS